MDTYKIIRYHQDKPNRIVCTGLTLAEAQFHCKQKGTSGPNWFDGYTKE